MQRTRNEEYDAWKSEYAREWLRYIRREQLAAVALQDEMETLRSIALRAQDTTASHVSGTPGIDAVAKAANDLIELTDELAAQLSALGGIRRDAHDRLMRLEDTRYSTILVLYYVDGRTWQQVADKAHYEVETVMRIRTEALPYVYDVMPNEWRQMIPRAD